MEDIQPEHMAYDRTIAVFSPDGRLLQVEYAKQAVKRGSIVIGLTINEYVLLATVKMMHSKLLANNSFKKIYKIDEHIMCAASGLLADAKCLVSIARVKAQVNRLTYGDEISVRKLTHYIAENMHIVTQYAGVRPYGVGFLIGGVDRTGARLFETDPSGTVVEWKAAAIGRGSEKAKKILESGYKKDMKLKDAIALVKKAIKSVEKVDDTNIEVAIISKKGIKVTSIAEISKKV